MKSSGARWFNAILGTWLFISAFAWPHTGAQFTNSWIVGAASVALALAAARVPNVRYINVALAVWLFISVGLLPTSTDTFWNNLVVSVLMLVAALTPSVARPALGRTEAAGTNGLRSNLGSRYRPSPRQFTSDDTGRDVRH